jgi:hypothetical protein
MSLKYRKNKIKKGNKMNEVVTAKERKERSLLSYDSKDAKEQITKAQKNAKKGDIHKTIGCIKIAQDILRNSMQKLKQKDRIKAFHYLNEIF